MILNIKYRIEILIRFRFIIFFHFHNILRSTDRIK